MCWQTTGELLRAGEQCGQSRLVDDWRDVSFAVANFEITYPSHCRRVHDEDFLTTLLTSPARPDSVRQHPHGQAGPRSSAAFRTSTLPYPARMPAANAQRSPETRRPLVIGIATAAFAFGILIVTDRRAGAVAGRGEDLRAGNVSRADRRGTR